jgi:hypothetical protein
VHDHVEDMAVAEQTQKRSISSSAASIHRYRESFSGIIFRTVRKCSTKRDSSSIVDINPHFLTLQQKKSAKEYVVLRAPNDDEMSEVVETSNESCRLCVTIGVTI